MLGNYQGLDTPVIDPETQAALDRWRQEQLAQQLAGQQQDVGTAKNTGEGIAALGKGFTNMLMGFKTADAAKQQQAALSQLGNINTTSSMLPFPSYNAPPMAAGGLPPALQSATPSKAELAGGLTLVQQQIADTWRRHGANDTTIAGVLGNVAQESGFNPSLSPNKEGGGGLYQHRAERYTGVRNYAAGSNAPSPVSQSEYSIGEMGGPAAPGLSMAKLNSLGNAAEVSKVFGQGFERPAEKYANWAGRAANANKFAALLGQAPKVGPATYGVPPGQVAGGNVVPTRLPPPVEPTTPEGRAAALGAVPPPQPLPPPRPTDLASTGGPGPSAVNPDIAVAPQPMGPTPSAVNPALSPVPMGPPQGFAPPGGGPGAAVGSPSAAAPTTPVIPPQAAAPPMPARPIAPAPGVGGPQGSAYDPRTGRFLAPGEQIPGYAPAPMSSTGGPGGLGGLLAGLFGAGPAQAAPAGPAIARGLAGAPAPVPAAPVGGPVVGAAPAMAAPQPQGGGTYRDQLATAYQQSSQEAQLAQRRAQLAAGTPYAAVFQKQADAANDRAKTIWQEGNKLVEEQRKTAEARVRPMTRAEGDAILGPGSDISGYVINPTTGLPVKVAEKKEEPVTWGAPTPEQAARLPGGGAGYQVSSRGEFKPIKEQAEAAPIQEYKFYQQQQEAAGKEVMPFEQWQKKSGANVSTDLLDKSGVPIDSSLPIDEIRAAAPPPVVATADAMRAGKQAVPSGGGRNAAALYNQALILARQQEPDFDMNVAKQRLHTHNDFTSSTPNSSGGAIAALGTSLGHLSHGIDVVDRLGNVQQGSFFIPAQWQNAYKNWRESRGGGPIGDTITELQATADRFNEEATKFYRGIGGTEKDIERGLVRWDPSLPPSQLRTEMQTQARLMMSKADQLQSRWHEGMDGTSTTAPDFPVVSPKAQEAYDNIFARGAREPPPGGAPAATPAATVPGGAALQPPAPPAAPLGGGAVSGAATALRGGLPFVNNMVAGAQTLLPAGYGGGAPSYQENLARMLSQQVQFQQQHPDVALAGKLTPYAPAVVNPGVGRLAAGLAGRGVKTVGSIAKDRVVQALSGEELVRRLADYLMGKGKD